MKYDLILREEAEKELIDESIYYEEQQLGLCSRFLDCVEDLFERILKNPKLYEEKSPPNREAYLQKFPFLIVY